MKTAGVLKLSGVALILALVLAAFAVLLPRSPYYLPKILNSGPRFEGYSAGHWMQELENPDAELRQHAVFALGAIGPDAGEAVPALAGILSEDPDAGMRLQASLALSKMAPASRAAVSALARALSDEELAIRHNAALALLKLRTEARPAVPALIEAFKDKRNETNLGKFIFTIQELVAVALGHASAGDGEAVPILHNALKTKQRAEMELCLVRGLGAIGAPARPALPQLRSFLTSSRPELQEAAVDAVKNIEAAGKPGAGAT